MADSNQIKQQLLEIQQEDSSVYSELLSSNLFIIGGVATGKTELMQTLQRELPHIAVDVGKLFRMIAHLILTDSEDAINPDIGLLQQKDPTEIERIISRIFNKTRYLERSLLEGAKFSKEEDGSLRFNFFGQPYSHELETAEVNSLVSVVAKSPKVREIIWKWINRFAQDSGGVLITGHNLRETDTTTFKVLHLTVDDDVAGERLMGRSNYSDVQAATDSVISRNTEDKLPETEAILERVNGVIRIETDELNLDQVALESVRGLGARIKREQFIKRKLEEGAIERENFDWVFNPVMSVLRGKIDILLSRMDLPREISRFDLLMQCLLTLPAFDLKDLFVGVDQNLEDSLLQAIRERKDTEFADLLATYELNEQVITNIIQVQIQRLLGLATDNRFEDLYGDTPQLEGLKDEYSINRGKGRYIDGDICQHLILPIGNGHSLTLRPVDSSVSAEYAYRLHYLHSQRFDEFLGFGAYLDDNPYPIAWVSYSHHDRPYKMELFQSLGLESHNILEMTRAWNVMWSPKNTMSFLFSYAHEELKTIWEDMRTQFKTDKPLAGISTTINPNLGFKGSAFSGSSFSVVALRPATLQYSNMQGHPRYITRREISRQGLSGDTFEAKIPQLPLNEMLMVYNTKKQSEIEKGKIYRIDPNIYEEI